ncbi:MAG: hypothetical protein MUC51_00895 [Anaerolineae bacterium]|nr:hypothetical protein [Anaerolineae bacterium]
MPFYTSTEQLYAATSIFFERVGKEFPHAGDALLKQKMTVRLSTVEPVGVFGLDGRHAPLKTHIGAVPFRPDLDIEMPADLLHATLMGQASIKSGLASGKLKARGAILKALSLSSLFQQGQKIYPQVLREQGLIK